jgi:hypothetical protein
VRPSTRLLVVFAGLIVGGLLLTSIPVSAGPSEVLTPRQPDAAFNATTPLSITGYWAIGVSWSSNQSVSLLVVVCRSVDLSGSSLQTVCPGASLTELSGIRGSATFWVPVGGVLLVGLLSTSNSAPAVQVTLRLSLALFGAVLVVAGAAVGVGLLWDHGRSRAIARGRPPPAA